MYLLYNFVLVMDLLSLLQQLGPEPELPELEGPASFSQSQSCQSLVPLLLRDRRAATQRVAEVWSNRQGTFKLAH